MSLNLNSAVSTAIATRLWSGAAGLVSLALIARFLDGPSQGYYYTFLSLIALQSFVELGILIVIVSVASHEWAHLSLSDEGRVVGDPTARARLISLGRFVALWFGAMCAIFAVAAGVLGSLFLERQGDTEVTWRAAWIVTVVAAAANLWAGALLALLEGCNQVKNVARYRLVQVVTCSVGLWIALASGAALWSLTVMIGLNVLCAAVFFVTRYRRFFLTFWESDSGSTFSWRKDIWPMQWQLALQGLFGYFMYSLFVPVTFEYEGATAAGRIGMSLQVSAAIAGVASTWLVIGAPRLGVLAARGQAQEFEGMWRRAALTSMAVAAVGAAALLAALALADFSRLEIVDNVLPSSLFGLLLVWMLTNQSVQCLATYWRARKIEPTGVWGFVPGALSGIAIWQGGRSQGAAGAVLGAVGVVLFVNLPIGIYYWRKVRARPIGAAAQAP